LFREGLDTLSRLPENQVRIRVVFHNQWALSLASRGDLDAAEAELNSSLTEARKPGVADDFPPALAARRMLAWVYVLRDEPARAEPLADEVLERIRPVMGDQHPYTLNAIWALARVYQAQGRYEKAAPLIKEAEEGSRGSGEEGIPRLAFVLGMRGHNLVAKQKFAEAEEPLRECLAIWAKCLPHGGYYFMALSRRSAAREYAYAKSLLGVALMGQKNYDKAAPFLLEGYEGLKPQLGFNEDLTPLARRYRVEALERLVQLYDEWAKPDEAAKWRKELEAVQAAAKPVAGP
jgi:tetratricopeptide (TPR) repeat protein